MSSHAPRAVLPSQDSGGRDSNVFTHGQPQAGHHEMSYQSSAPSRTDQMQTHSEHQQSQELSHGVMSEMHQSQSQVLPQQMAVQMTSPEGTEVANVGASAMQTDSAGDQGFYAPALFTLENYYWNNYQAFGMQQQQHEMPATMGSYPAHNIHTHAQPQPQAQSHSLGEIGTQGAQGQHNNVYFHLMRALGDGKHAPQT